MFRFIGELMAAIWNEWRQFYEDNFTWEDPKVRLQNQLRILYGRGEIPSARFLEMHTRLERGQIGLGDIQMVHRENIRRIRKEGQDAPDASDREIARSLNRLYIDRGLVEEARAELARSQQALIQEGEWVRTQIDAARKNAQAALPDEDQARSHLQIWQRLTYATDDIQARQRALEQQMQRIGEMEAELRAAISRLKLLDAQGRLAELNLQLRQDLFAQIEKR